MMRIVLLSSLVLFSLACGTDGLQEMEAPEPARVAVTIDPTVAPTTSHIAGANGPRALSRVVDQHGTAADFVKNEMIVAGDSPAAIVDFVARWDAAILRLYNPPDGIEGPVIALVQINLNRVDGSNLGDEISAVAPQIHSSLRLSDADGTRLLSVAARATLSGTVKVAANWVTEGHGIAEGAATEAAAGNSGYVSDPFRWHYMTRGSKMDIGVTDAWRILEASGRANQRVPLMVMDGGFTQNDDLAHDAEIYPRNGWGTPNAWDCGGGNPCPWHGTSVASTAAGLIDNGYGAAGTGAPVARPILVQSPAQDFFSILEYAFWTAPSSLFEAPRVINISAGVPLPAAACAVACPALHSVTSMGSMLGITVVASAGNAGINVDEEDCFLGVCWEATTHIPCELDRVLCIGGLNWDSTNKSSGSNYGTDKGSKDSVDIYAPYTVWVGPTPTDTPGRARTISGTSFSSPFIAGVIALMIAADPSLGPNDIWRILKNTAHTGSTDRRINRWVNAFGAVKEALGGNAPPLINITNPGPESSYPHNARINFSATGSDEEGATLNYTWTSSIDGVLGHGEQLSINNLSVGLHEVGVTVRDNAGWTVHDSVVVNIAAATVGTNVAPQIVITAPTHGVTLEAQSWDGTQPYAMVELHATSFDREDGPLDDDAVVWTARFVNETQERFVATGKIAWVKLYTQVCWSEGYELTATATDSTGNQSVRRVGVAVQRGCE